MIIGKVNFKIGERSQVLIPRAMKYFVIDYIPKIPGVQVYTLANKDGHRLIDDSTMKCNSDSIRSDRPLYVELENPAEKELEFFLLGESLDD